MRLTVGSEARGTGRRWPLGEPERAEALAALGRFPTLHIGVLGDVMIDQYIAGSASRISPEAPVPVVAVQHEDEFRLGGAGNVVENLRSLGAEVRLIGVVGDDAGADRIGRLLDDLRVPTDGLVRDATRPTTRKVRVVAAGQHVVRLDWEKTHPAGADVQTMMLTYLGSIWDWMDALIVSDYGKGTVTESILRALGGGAGGARKVVTVDPNVRSVRLYHDMPMSVMTPNQQQALHWARVLWDDGSAISVQEAGRLLLDEVRSCDAVLITRGEHGMLLAERRGSVTAIPAVPREVRDVTGAGDTVISVVTLGLAAGLPLRVAAALANSAAGLVVEHVGAVPVRPNALRAEMAADVADAAGVTT